jgi:RNA polymerase sigma-70 factor (ECF subfamily)
LSQKQQQNSLEHVFRHEYGSLVATLARRIGIQHIDLIEDAVQWSMAQALTHWSLGSEPENSSAWLYQVALRHVLSEFRKNKCHQTILNQQFTTEDDELDYQSEVALPNELNDSLLRMLFLACDENIPIESQLVFTLKSLCGFSISEIAARLFLSEANVYKRFSRARNVLMKQNFSLDEVNQSQVKKRMPAVYSVLYLVFTEGYLSSHPDLMIRKDLCEEASRLAFVLAQHQWGKVPQTYALLALMYFNLARLDTRENQAGLVLLEHQDRRLWDKQKIAQALAFLNQSACGDSISRFHIEASIAAEHCLAARFQDTRWDKIVAAYELLAKVAPSPLHMLNRALAVAEYKSAKEGLVVLELADIPTWLERSYHWYAVLADLQFRAKHTLVAKENAEKAINMAPNDGIKDLLKRRMARYSADESSFT